MLPYPNINPIAFSVGPVKVHWYGIMYLIGFAGGWYLGAWRARRRTDIPYTPEQVGDLLFYAALGVILGGRTGYMLFYDLPNFIHDPLTFFQVWHGGMSFHGGLMGVMIAFWYFARRTGTRFFDVADFAAPLVPIGLGAGRIGNFINGELWGRVTTVPWAMVFPKAGPLPRHPSQIYEFLLEGMVLFTVLWIFSRRKRPVMSVSGLFLLLYGCFRFFVEFFRQPDPQLGFVAFGWMTMGQVLSLPMVLFGIILLYLAYRRRGVTA
ncbi:MAG TPA: prolipoprotein diacylglyceryl transferase [Gammaproteobacteria bacterium]|nr:prolipoprotein diacylglyceryl transferase [Gammaproteobacteria bacterium]